MLSDCWWVKWGHCGGLERCLTLKNITKWDTLTHFASQFPKWKLSFVIWVTFSFPTNVVPSHYFLKFQQPFQSPHTQLWRYIVLVLEMLLAKRHVKLRFFASWSLNFYLCSDIFRSSINFADICLVVCFVLFVHFC